MDGETALAPKDAHEPERMCVICRRRLPKRELTRYTAPSERGAAPTPDPRQVRPGRGYYLCGEAACRERFQRFKGFRRKQGDSL